MKSGATAEAGIPLNQYAAEVLSGERKPGYTGSLSEDDFTDTLRRLNFIEDTIRCGACFAPESLGCPGMSWLQNLIREETGDTYMELACPLDVKDDQTTGAVPSILFNLSRFKQ
jgi:hypothetical protein